MRGRLHFGCLGHAARVVAGNRGRGRAEDSCRRYIQMVSISLEGMGKIESHLWRSGVECVATSFVCFSASSIFLLRNGLWSPPGYASDLKLQIDT